MRKAITVLCVAGGLLATGALAQVAPPVPADGRVPMSAGGVTPGRAGGLMRADANHDGAISRAEMIADAQARFAAMDANGDGKVTGDERDAARAAMRAQRRGAGDGRRSGPGGGPEGSFGGGPGGDPDRVVTREEDAQRAGARFDRLDGNRDGMLDAAEIAAMRPMRGRGAGALPPASPLPSPPAPPAPAPR